MEAPLRMAPRHQRNEDGTGVAPAAIDCLSKADRRSHRTSFEYLEMYLNIFENVKKIL